MSRCFFLQGMGTRQDAVFLPLSNGTEVHVAAEIGLAFVIDRAMPLTSARALWKQLRGAGWRHVKLGRRDFHQVRKDLKD